MHARRSAIDGLKPPHILVVDPEPASSHRLQEILRVLGYEVALARDAESALLRYEQETCAVIVNMSEEYSGHEVIRALRLNARRPRFIGFGGNRATAPGPVLLVVPVPLEAKVVETAVAAVRGMRKLPSLPTPRQMSVKPAA